MRENYKKTFYITLLLSIFFILLSILILYYPKALITTIYYTLGIITGILGIIGIILVFVPYFIIIGVFAYDTIKKKFKNLTVQNLLAGITIVFLFGISYMSGNLLNSLSFIIYFALPFVILQKR